MIFVFHSTHHQVKKSSQNHQTWLCTNHAKINSFCTQTFPTSLWKHLWGLSPSTFPKPWFSFFTPDTTKSENVAKITKLGYAPTIPRSIPFAPKIFPHHFGRIREDWVHPFFKNHVFRFSPHTTPSHKIYINHQTWLSTNHGKINSFCTQSFPTSLWRHLWGLCPETFPKPWFLFFTQHTTKSQNLAKITKLGHAPTIPISIPFVPKLFPHHFGSIWEDWVHPVFKNYDFSFFTPHTT